MVRRIARRVFSRLPRRCDIELEDLVAAGTIGLMQAVSRFDPSRGIRFEGYASRRIRGAMLDEIRDLDHLARSHRRELKAGGAKQPQVFQLRTDDPALEVGGWGQVLADPRAQHDLELLEISDIWQTASAATDDVEFRVLLMRYMDGLAFNAIGDAFGRSALWAMRTNKKAIERVRRRLTRSSQHGGSYAPGSHICRLPCHQPLSPDLSP